MRAESRLGLGLNFSRISPGFGYIYKQRAPRCTHLFSFLSTSTARKNLLVIFTWNSPSVHQFGLDRNIISISTLGSTNWKLSFVLDQKLSSAATRKVGKVKTLFWRYQSGITGTEFYLRSAFRHHLVVWLALRRNQLHTLETPELWNNESRRNMLCATVNIGPGGSCVCTAKLNPAAFGSHPCSKRTRDQREDGGRNEWRERWHLHYIEDTDNS